MVLPMNSEYIIPKKMPQYLRRLVQEYSGGDYAHIGEVIAGSTFRVVEETSYDNWNGGQHGHDLVFVVPDHLMGKIPLNDQRDIQIRITEDLNKAAASAHDEFISEVYFEHPDGDEHLSSKIASTQNATSDHERLWHPGTIRAFISHRDTAKNYVHQLAAELETHGVSSFVAHEDIEPDEDWQREIELALQSMDVMLVFITNEFFDSPWTNQEIGYALARRVPVISIKVEKQDPVGFIRNRQAIKGALDDAAHIAPQIAETIKKRLPPARYRECTLHYFMNARSFDEAAIAFERVRLLSNMTGEEIAMLVESYNSNSQLHRCFKLTEHDRFLNWVNDAGEISYCLERGKITEEEPWDEEMPF